MDQTEIVKKILQASKSISKSSRSSSANYIITHSEVSKTIEDIIQEQKLRKISSERNQKLNKLLEMDFKQNRYDITYLKMAKNWSELSHCQRKKVGALIVKNGMLISDGYNGTPSGFDNCCENEHNETHWYTIHAEANAILKCAKWGNSCNGSTLYLTHSPCKECSKLILQSGISRVVYTEDYKDLDGVEFLRRSKIEVEKLEIS
jgi:dCMP deaminase